jgi:hypothetical protein
MFSQFIIIVRYLLISFYAASFSLASESRPALRPTQPAIQWVPEVLSPGVKRGRGVTLTTQPNLVPRVRMRRNYTSFSLSWRVAGHICSGSERASVKKKPMN